MKEDLSKAVWGRIQDEIKTGRDGYNDGQFSEEMEGAIDLTAAVMTTMDCNQSRPKLVSARKPEIMLQGIDIMCHHDFSMNGRFA